MYSIKEFFRRSPSEIASGVLVLVNLAVLLDMVKVGEEALGGMNIALVTVLGLFYVGKTTTSNAQLETLKASEVESNRVAVEESKAASAVIVEEAGDVSITGALGAEGGNVPTLGNTTHSFRGSGAEDYEPRTVDPLVEPTRLVTPEEAVPVKKAAAKKPATKKAAKKPAAKTVKKTVKKR